MSQGWKQIWEDILNSIKGDSTSEAVVPTAQPEVGSGEEIEPVEGEVLEEPVEPAVPITEPSSLEPAEPVGNILPETYPADVDSVPQIPAKEAENVSPRKLAWQNAGLLVGILIVAALIWITRSNGSILAPQPPSPDVIATFNGGQITIADLEEHLVLLVPDEFQQIMNSPYILQQVVQDMVTDELARRWALERQPDTDETFAHTMEHITEEINLESFDSQLHENAAIVSESEIQDYYYANQEQFGDQTLDAVRETIRQTLVAEREPDYVEAYIQRLRDNASITRDFELLDVPNPSEDDLRRYYTENAAQFTLPTQVIVDELAFPIGQDERTTRQQADDALLSFRSGATLEQLAQENTNVTFTATSNVEAGSREPEWETVVFELTEGEVSTVFRAGNSFYIVRLLEFEDERTPTFEEVRDVVLPIVQQQQTDIWFEQNSDRTLFTLKGRRYTVGQFYQEYQELSPVDQAQFVGSEGMRNLAEQLIDRLLLVEDTYDQLLDSQNQPLTDETRLQVLKQMLHQENVDDQIEVTEEEMQQFYAANQEMMVQPAEARIRYIRIGLGSSEDEAQRGRERANEAYNRLVPGTLQTGEDFAIIAQEYSEDPQTAANGGELPGWIGEGDDLLAEMELHPFHERILTLQPSEISPVFEFGDSLYIVQVIERTEPATVSFEQARASIQAYLYQQEHETMTVQLEDRLLEQAGFTIYSSVLEAYFNQDIIPSP